MVFFYSDTIVYLYRFIRKSLVNINKMNRYTVALHTTVAFMQ